MAFFIVEQDLSVPSIEANVATGNTIRFRGRSFTYGDPTGIALHSDCEIHEISYRRHGHRRLISASIVALCPFDVPSTPFRQRGNVP